MNKVNGIDTTTRNCWSFSPSLLTSSGPTNCSQILVPQGFCDSAPLPRLYLLLWLVFWKMILFHLLPPLQTLRPLILCWDRTIPFTSPVELLCLHYKAKSLGSCSSPHPLPDLSTSWVLWSLLILNHEEKLNMPTAEPGEELCAQIRTCADGLAVKLTSPHFCMNRGVEVPN